MTKENCVTKEDLAILIALLGIFLTVMLAVAGITITIIVSR